MWPRAECTIQEFAKWVLPWVRATQPAVPARTCSKLQRRLFLPVAHIDVAPRCRILMHGCNISQPGSPAGAGAA